MHIHTYIPCELCTGWCFVPHRLSAGQLSSRPLPCVRWWHTGKLHHQPRLENCLTSTCIINAPARDTQASSSSMRVRIQDRDRRDNSGTERIRERGMKGVLIRKDCSESDLNPTSLGDVCGCRCGRTAPHSTARTIIGGLFLLCLFCPRVRASKPAACFSSDSSQSPRMMVPILRQGWLTHHNPKRCECM